MMLGAAALSLASFGVCEAALWAWGGESQALAQWMVKSCTLWAVFFALGAYARRTPGLWDGLWRFRGLLFAAGALSVAVFVAELEAVDQWLGYNPQRQTMISGLPCCLTTGLITLLLFRRAENLDLLRGLIRRLASLARYTYGIYLVHTTALFLVYSL
jgi:hypothetical protein